MKIKSVIANNRKKAFIVKAAARELEFPFALLKLKPTGKNPIQLVYVDQEIGGEGFTYQLKDGKEDTVLLDQVLHVNQDPDYVRDHLLYKLSLEADKLIAKQKVSKRAIARRLSISPTQLYRLLDQTFYGKTIDQMVRLFTVLGQNVEVKSTKVA